MVGRRAIGIETAVGPVGPEGGGVGGTQRQRGADQRRLGMIHAAGEVDGPAVVGIDQRVVPPLGALIDVGYAGPEDRDSLARQRFLLPGIGDPGHQVSDHTGDRVGGHRVDPVEYRGLEVVVDLGPGGA